MIRKKPVPDAIRDGSRFFEQTMLQAKWWTPPATIRDLTG